MDMTTIGYLLAIVGGFVGLAGWLSGRDDKNIKGAEWRGEINGKLDAILGIDRRVDDLQKTLEGQTLAIRLVERDTKSAHQRLDSYKEVLNKHTSDGHGGRDR
jgi:hypothetical protein